MGIALRLLAPTSKAGSVDSVILRRPTPKDHSCVLVAPGCATTGPYRAAAKDDRADVAGAKRGGLRRPSVSARLTRQARNA